MSMFVETCSDSLKHVTHTTHLFTACSTACPTACLMSTETTHLRVFMAGGATSRRAGKMVKAKYCKWWKFDVTLAWRIWQIEGIRQILSRQLVTFIFFTIGCTENSPNYVPLTFFESQFTKHKLSSFKVTATYVCKYKCMFPAVILHKAKAGVPCLLCLHHIVGKVVVNHITNQVVSYQYTHTTPYYTAHTHTHYIYLFIIYKAL